MKRPALISALVFALTTAITLALWDQLFHRVPFALYFAGVAICAWYGGWFLGMSMALAGVLVVSVYQGFRAELIVPSIVLLGVSALISLFAAARSRVMNELRASNAHNAAVIEGALDCIIGMDDEGCIVEWNPAAARTFGSIREEVIGKEMAQIIIPPSLREAHRKGMAHYLATGLGPVLGKRIEITGIRKDGTEFPVELTITRLAQDGPPVFTGHLRDITDRKRTEARDHFLLVLEDTIRLLNDPDHITQACAKLLGEHLEADRCAYADVEADEDTFNLTGDYNRGVPSIVGRYRFADFGAEALRLMRADKPYVVNDVDTHQPPVGDLSYYRQAMIQAVICVPLHKAGKFVAAMAVHQKAPRQWTAEEVKLVGTVAERCWESIERARVVRVLRHSEAEFRLLADAMPQIVWAARSDGQLDYYNRQWFEYIKLSPESTDDIRWDRYLHPDDVERVYQEWTASVQSGTPYNTEFRVRRGDGEYRWFLVRALPIRTGDGNIVRWFGTCTDVHDHKALEEQNQQLLESERAARTEAERASQMKDEFLATLSHELRTPLNAILGWSQILSGGGGNDGDDLRQGLETIDRNARAQTQIIEDLLDMSRIISGKLRLDVQRLDVASVVQSATQTVQPAADAKGIRIHSVLDPIAGPISGDPNRLQQVFWNLLSNAIKFTPKDGRVQVVLERVNSHLEVSVTDTGEGIAAAFLPHVFDRFRQADATTTRRHGGLGLGLAIAKQLVELHGGSIRVKSAGAGKGSTFTVMLPLTVIHPEPNEDMLRRHPQRSIDPVTRDMCVKLKGVKVLVVDDEPDARDLIQRLLEDCDAVVETAASAEDAIKRIGIEPPDVLISDIGMPGEDGYGLIRRIRALANNRGGDVPAIALTAYARSEDRTRAILAGFQIHVSKPVEPNELVAIVASLAGRKSN